MRVSTSSWICGLLGLLAVPGQALAQVADAEAPATPSATLGLVWTNQYFFRGIVQETEGAILQPSIESSFPLYQGDTLTDVGLEVGLWSSLHSEHPSIDTGPASWYEADFYAGLSFVVIERLSVGVVYTAYVSPNGSFRTVHELAGSVGWDDSPSWERLAGQRFAGIQPTITVARELDGTAFGPDEGTYLQAAIEPGVSLWESRAVSLDARLPIVLGLSLGDYYEDDAGDDAFGYVNAGLSFDAGLGIVPVRYGGWQLSLGASILILGERLRVANDDDGVELLAQAGLSVAH